MDLQKNNILLRVYKHPINMHRSFNGLLTLAISELEVDIQKDAYVLFMNRDRNQFKILFMQQGHISIYTTRLSGSLKADFTKMDFIESRTLSNLIKNLACRKSRIKGILSQ